EAVEALQKIRVGVRHSPRPRTRTRRRTRTRTRKPSEFEFDDEFEFDQACAAVGSAKNISTSETSPLPPGDLTPNPSPTRRGEPRYSQPAPLEGSPFPRREGRAPGALWAGWGFRCMFRASSR